MAIGPRLEQRLGQSLVMTPQLRQAIKLLQLSNLELTEFVEQELEKNPLLEAQEADGPMAPETPAPADADRFDGATASGAESDSAASAASDQLPADNDAPLDADYSNVYDNAAPDGPGYAQAMGRGGRADFGDADGLEQTLTRDKTLREHLRDQLMVDVGDPADRIIGQYLIDMLDAAGYLDGDLEAVAVALGCDRERVEATLEAVQNFDPPGIFARDLRECLALQLRDRDRLDPAMAALLDNLELLAARDLAALMECCGVDAEDLADMIGEIKALNPKPGADFEHAVVQSVVPDVFVRQLPDKTWFVELNSDTLPRVLVDRRYHARVNRAARGKADKAYVAEQLQSANWLVRSLDQRANTILKVATELVRKQDGFFERGVQHLRPLTLRDIAEEVEMHESTVSRVTSNKYIATPRGVFELKYFFTSAIASSHGGDSHSAEAVRHRIKKLIEAEPADAVLSDDRIVTTLNAAGIDIARRTVAKYREAMRIPSSVRRRRQKAALS